MGVRWEEDGQVAYGTIDRNLKMGEVIGRAPVCFFAPEQDRAFRAEELRAIAEHLDSLSGVETSANHNAQPEVETSDADTG
jgi:hypothetical protein